MGEVYQGTGYDNAIRGDLKQLVDKLGEGDVQAGYTETYKGVGFQFAGTKSEYDYTPITLVGLIQSNDGVLRVFPKPVKIEFDNQGTIKPASARILEESTHTAKPVISKIPNTDAYAFIIPKNSLGDFASPTTGNSDFQKNIADACRSANVFLNSKGANFLPPYKQSAFSKFMENFNAKIAPKFTEDSGLIAIVNKTGELLMLHGYTEKGGFITITGTARLTDPKNSFSELYATAEKSGTVLSAMNNVFTNPA